MRLPAQRNGPATRQEICNALAHEPGLTKAQLCRLLDLSWGTIAHHVRRLDLDGVLVRRTVRHRTRFFLVRDASLDVHPLSFEPLVAPLLDAVVRNPGIAIRELSAAMSVDRRTIRRHLDLLIDSGLVAQTRDYRPRFFVVERERASRLIGDMQRPGRGPA